MSVSKNNSTPKSSILIGLSLINHPFWGTTIFGNTQMEVWFRWFSFSIGWFLGEPPLILWFLGSSRYYSGVYKQFGNTKYQALWICLPMSILLKNSTMNRCQCSELLPLLLHALQYICGILWFQGEASNLSTSSLVQSLQQENLWYLWYLSICILQFGASSLGEIPGSECLKTPSFMAHSQFCSKLWRDRAFVTCDLTWLNNISLVWLGLNQKTQIVQLGDCELAISCHRGLSMAGLWSL